MSICIVLFEWRMDLATITRRDPQIEAHHNGQPRRRVPHVKARPMERNIGSTGTRHINLCCLFVVPVQTKTVYRLGKADVPIQKLSEVSNPIRVSHACWRPRAAIVGGGGTEFCQIGLTSPNFWCELAQSAIVLGSSGTAVRDDMTGTNFKPMTKNKDVTHFGGPAD
ncbi:hypothetical protein BC827DRAFT_613802 [Russula dissimulans]|nr:hypothetical protein BC827DRAFT_613802 [Russula dissimulans]